MQWVSLEDGQVHECQVLIAVLPYSQYTFAIALASQKVLDLAHGITEALLFFGGVPQVILSDNMKAFVIRPGPGGCVPSGSYFLE